jgi:hypothetical protein
LFEAGEVCAAELFLDQMRGLIGTFTKQVGVWRRLALKPTH